MLKQLPNNLDSIIHIGAGKCQELKHYLATQAQKIVLVEPIPTLAATLCKKVENEARVEVMELAISNDNHSSLHQFNLVETSSLYTPAELTTLFPGIKTVSKHSVAIQSPEVFIDDLNLAGSRNGLILQAPGAEVSIVKCLAESGKLSYFSYIEVLSFDEPLYSSQSSIKPILHMLNEHGYEQNEVDTSNPDFPRWQFSCNPLQQPFNELTDQYQATIESLRQIQIELEQAKDKHKSHSEEQAEIYKTKLKETEDKLTVVERDLAHATAQLEKFDNSNTRFDDLEAKLNSLSNNVRGHIDKRLHNTNRQLESFISLQGYLSHGDIPLSYHDWPISPDIALFLVEKIESNNYDLIIEFGSGTSTALFAKTILNKSLKSNVLNSRNNFLESQAQSHQELSQVAPDDDDLPKRVISFEHKKEYYKKTQDLLNVGGLQQVVELVHAPLVDYHYKGDDYLYYACDTTLAHIAKMFEGRVAKILVLVDGPPALTGPLARFPALPKLLNNLSTHNLHILMDDYAREDEKTIVTKWGELLNARGIDFTESSLNFEKGAAFLTLNEAL